LDGLDANVRSWWDEVSSSSRGVLNMGTRSKTNNPYISWHCILLLRFFFSRNMTQHSQRLAPVSPAVTTFSRTKEPHIMGHVKVVTRQNGISAVSTKSSF
jgi:hypothetical protein